MLRRTSLEILGATLTLGALGALGRVRIARAAATPLKIGTVFAKSTSWGMGLDVWKRTVATKTAGAVDLQLSYGSAGDEDTILTSLKAGDLDGAVLSARAIGKLHAPVAGLEMPLFRSWASLDRARAAIGPELEKGALGVGYWIVAWLDVGMIRWLSRGLAIHAPDDLKSKAVGQFRWDLLEPSLVSVLGAFGAPVGSATVANGFANGGIKALRTSCLLAEQMLWLPQVDNLHEAVSGIAVDGIVFNKKKLDALTPDLRGALIDAARASALETGTKVRAADDAAFARLKARLTSTAPTPAETVKWQEAYLNARRKQAVSPLSLALVEKLESFAK
jgi:TRAP-type C4-dicarboxylate transport system substrate-binding protein